MLPSLQEERREKTRFVSLSPGPHGAAVSQPDGPGNCDLSVPGSKDGAVIIDSSLDATSEGIRMMRKYDESVCPGTC